MFIDDINEQLTSAIDQHLLEFFGTEENARAIGHLYVLETKPIRFEAISGTEYVAKQDVRIRLKTKEELEHEDSQESQGL
jgi:hypothetical protein